MESDGPYGLVLCLALENFLVFNKAFSQIVSCASYIILHKNLPQNLVN